MKHPAKELGKWLKARRREESVVLRVFAGQISLAPSEYAEVEAGVVRWLSKTQEKLIPEILAFPEDDTEHFKGLLKKARSAKPLEFDDVFTREQLEPVRARSRDRQLTPETKTALLDAVFKPLS